MTHSVTIRADGSRRIGHGHIFRTLTLAEELTRRGYTIRYVCRDLPGSPCARIGAAGHEISLLGGDLDEFEDAQKTLRVAQDNGAEWIVVDRYETDEKAYKLFRECGIKVLAIDDLCDHPFHVDVLLNQNTDAKDLRYQCAVDTVRLLGPAYALVRDAYRSVRPVAPKQITRVENVLVFMGGGDPDDVTGEVLAALDEVPGPLHIEVVVGGAYPHYEQLVQSVRSHVHTVTVKRDLPDLAKPMSRADIAIAAGGSVVWELCCMGVPMILRTIARNQEGIAASLEELGAAKRIGGNGTEQEGRVLGELISDASLISQMRNTAYYLVDGMGAARVAEQMGEMG